MYRSFIRRFILTLTLLIRIAFYTLIERKFLGYSQIRKGPNKPRLSGLPIPLADAVKLFTKEQINPTIANSTPFYIAPTIALLIAILLGNLIPSPQSIIILSISAPLFSAIARLNVYTSLTAG